ncbi:MAG: tetratricopeptide repeat protein [Planctomycetota bacterium]
MTTELAATRAEATESAVKASAGYAAWKEAGLVGTLTIDIMCGLGLLTIGWLLAAAYGMAGQKGGTGLVIGLIAGVVVLGATPAAVLVPIAYVAAWAYVHIKVSGYNKRYRRELTARLLNAEARLRDHPKSAEALRSKAHALRELGRTEEATACYRELTTRTSDDPDLHNELGLCLMEQKNYEEACRSFRAAVEAADEQAPQLEQYYHSLAKALKKTGRKQEAKNAESRARRVAGEREARERAEKAASKAKMDENSSVAATEDPEGGPATPREKSRTRTRRSSPKTDVRKQKTLDGAVNPVVFLLAGALVAAAYLGLRTVTQGWTRDFLFHRSPVQWISLYAFAVGMCLLVDRARVYLRERRAVRHLEKAGSGRGTTTWREIPASAVRTRFRRIRARMVKQGVAEAESHARWLAENDAADLDAGYTLLGDLVQVLPLVGFFGTVLGLSMGLYQRFGAAGNSDPQAFAGAIGTAFDTTLLALACTIVIIILKCLLRKREEAVLMSLNRFISSYVGQISGRVPSAHLRGDSGKDPQHGLDRLAQKVEAALAKAGEGNRKIAAAICSELGRQLAAVAEESARAIRQEIAEARRQAVNAVQASEERDHNLGTVAERMADAAQENVQAVNRLAATIAKHDGHAGRISIIDRPCTEKKEVEHETAQA